MSGELPPAQRTVTRARNAAACGAGLLRFVAAGEMDVLLGVLPREWVRRALHSHGMPNRVVAEALLRRGGRDDLGLLVGEALLGEHVPSLLGRLLDLDDPEINARLLLAGGSPRSAPRNLRRQLAQQTSRRDGVTPVPLPEGTLGGLFGAGKQPESLEHALLHAPDPDLAGRALRFLGAGADPHGAVRACRTLLDAGRVDALGELVAAGRLPAYRWGPGPRPSEPSVLAYAQAALVSAQGAQRLRELAERVRQPEFLRSVAEIADLDGCVPRWEHPVMVPTRVHRRHPCIPRVGWDAVLGDVRRWRASSGPLPYRVARFLSVRPDLPVEVARLVAADHPDLVALMPCPEPEVLAELCGRRSGAGRDALLKAVGNGMVGGTLTASYVVETVPEELLPVAAGSLWLPGMRGTAELRSMLGLTGDVVLEPLFVDETGHGRSRGLREPGRWADWDPELAYGPGFARLRGGRTTADEVLSVVSADALLAPSGGGRPDPRVLLRLAEHVHENLGGQPEAWMVALRLLEEGFAGSLPELLASAGAVAG